MERVLFGPGGATEAKQDEIIDLLANNKRLALDYTGGPSASDPVYLGQAPYSATTSDPAWKVQKLSYSGVNLTKIETRVDMAWDDRTSPSPAWD